MAAVFDEAEIQNDPPVKKKTRGRYLFWVMLVVIVFNTLSIVNEGYIGVLTRVGEAWKQLEPGLHLKFPFIESVKYLETRTRMVENDYQILSQEKMGLEVNIVANWHLPVSLATTFYQKYGTPEQFEKRVFLPLLQSMTRTVSARYSVEELLAKQDEIGSLIAKDIVDYIQPLATLESVRIKNIRLPETYKKRIEEKLARGKELEAEQLLLEKAKLKAQADYEIVEIKANAQIKQAEADAKIMLIRSEAKTLSITEVISAIKDSRTYIQYEKIQKWDGRLYSAIGNEKKMFDSIEK
jgi:regulator of protease activity HflC (stomatin/prohibitin superfamily)